MHLSRLPIIAPLLLLSISTSNMALADMLKTQVLIDYIEIRRWGWFYADSDPPSINNGGDGYYIEHADDGCLGNLTPVPDLTDLCIDWENKRAHFQFDTQTYKRCLILSGDNSMALCEGSPCLEYYWYEDRCTW